MFYLAPMEVYFWTWFHEHKLHIGRDSQQCCTYLKPYMNESRQLYHRYLYARLILSEIYSSRWACLNIDPQFHGFPFKWFISKHSQSILCYITSSKVLGCIRYIYCPFEVDAKVFYAEAGLEIRGEWRTADGTTGTLSGTKALAGLALGGPVWCLWNTRETWEIVMICSWYSTKGGKCLGLFLWALGIVVRRCCLGSRGEAAWETASKGHFRDITELNFQTALNCRSNIIPKNHRTLCVCLPSLKLT